MENVHINFLHPAWSGPVSGSGTCARARGTAFVGEQQKLTGPALALALPSPAVGADSWRAVLRSFNGFWAILCQDDQSLVASVDQVRSIPLFYGQSAEQFYLSDSAEWVRQQIGDTEMEPLAREEFLLAGYVTGPDTLFPGVKQLQAGEYLIIHQDETGIRLETDRYYRFFHKEPKVFDEADLRSELERVTLNSMRRLIDYAGSRQIVIPLSGGYDSRLIASMLKKIGYTNVICFTYGVPDNPEARYSKTVADSLGFEWIFVEYSKNLWRKEWKSSEAEAYRRMASGHTSLPHVQDWLAVKTLVADRRIERDAIFVPGHSGDFVAGSHIPDLVFYKKRHSNKILINSILNAHLSNRPREGLQLTSADRLAERVSNRIGFEFDGSDFGFANLYEIWDWQERQAKYIVNSVRVYEQFGHDWWLPQWDLEFIRFWQDVPLALRKKRIWFKSWIQQQYAGVSDEASALHLGNGGDVFATSPLIKLGKRMAPVLPQVLVRVLKKWRQRRVYSNHFLAFEGLISEGQFSDYSSRGYNIIGMYSDAEIYDKW